MSRYRYIIIKDLEGKGKGYSDGLRGFLQQEPIVKPSSIAESSSPSVENAAWNDYYVEFGRIYLFAQGRVRLHDGKCPWAELFSGLHKIALEALAGDDGAGQGRFLCLSESLFYYGMGVGFAPEGIKQEREP